MNQEDKQLLLKDLCARLPYGVMIQIPELFYPQRKVIEKLVTINDLWHFNDDGIYIENVKPYLRPMSSMTEEEKKEYHKLCDNYYDIYFDSVESIDWLNKKMFAYRKIDNRDMFELGLALEAQEGMYN